MNKEYVELRMETIKFETEDIITDSEGQNGNED